MPWNGRKPMDERLRSIARLLEGEKMAPLCREIGISRVTGCKIVNRSWSAALMPCMTVAGEPTDMPIGSLSRSNAASCGSSNFTDSGMKNQLQANVRFQRYVHTRKASQRQED